MNITVIYIGPQRTFDGGLVALWNVIVPNHSLDGSTLAFPMNLTGREVEELVRARL